MNIAQVKALTWVAALAVGGYLGWYVTDFLRQREVLRQEISSDILSGAVENVKKPERKETALVAYNRITHVFHGMNWTGEPPPAPKEKEIEGPPPAPPVVSADELVKVILTQADLRDPKAGFAMVSYKHDKLRSYNEDGSRRFLRPDEVLPSPFEGVQVKAVTGEGVLFGFEDGRDDELVGVLSYPKEGRGIVVLAPGEAPEQPQNSDTPDFPAYGGPSLNPKRTTQIGRYEYQLGTETLADVEADYSRILAKDVRYRTHRNPKTGLPDGIQVTSVRSGSIAANHGLSEGEVVKSINGHPVTSVTEGVSYVKANSDTTDTWIVVFEKQGKEYSRTYRSPSD